MRESYLIVTKFKRTLRTLEACISHLCKHFVLLINTIARF